MSTQNFAATFLQEAEELLRQVEGAALELESRPGDSDLVNQLFRAFHTIKGSGAMFGFNAVVAFTHHVETTLDHVREGRVGTSPELVSLVLAAKDHIGGLLAGASGAEAQATGERLTARFAAFCEHVAVPTSTAPPAPVENPPGEALARGTEERYAIFFQLEPSALGLGIDPGCILRELRELGPCTFHSGVEQPPPVAELGPDPLLRWELTLTTDKPLDAIRDAFIFVEDLAQIRIDKQPPTELGAAPPPEVVAPEARPAPEAPAPDAVRSEARAPEARPTPGARRPSRRVANPPPPDPGVAAEPGADTKGSRKRDTPKATVRVPSERLDQLVNLVGELVINQSRLTQAFELGASAEIAGAVEAMDRMIADLRDSVLGIRMMPIGSTFSRFQRLVRDLGTELGKQTDFVTEGAETELDKTVIDQLGDPLVHLIRNSMDHGIEPPEERVQKGKPSRGCLRLSAAHEGANVVITIRDDGRGLNGPALRAKAEAKGLISPDAFLTEQETFNLVFLPGLSTAKAVTNISGRGVGLDVVKRTIDDLRGSLNLSSAPGQGTTTRLTLPLTLAIVDGLLVEIDHDRFIIPMASVLENVELSSSERQAKNGRNLVNVRGELVPYVRLRDLFESPGAELEIEKVVIVAVHGQRLGLVVDHVLGSHQTVIQSLGRLYRNIELFSGTTIMGDGRVAIIVDLAGVVRHVERCGPGRSPSPPALPVASLPKRAAALESAI